MASHIEHITSILEEEGLIHLKGSLEQLTEDRFKDSPFYKGALEVFKDMGGIGDELPFGQNDFDIELIGKGLILDTDLNFNKYRTITFRSSVYDLMPDFPTDQYRRYCRQFEKECLKAGSNKTNWTSPEAETYFGPSNDPGDLGLSGSSKWKLRAMHDFLTDISAMILDRKVIRIALYDSVMIKGKITTLKELLGSRNPENNKYILAMIKKKLEKQIFKH